MPLKSASPPNASLTPSRRSAGMRSNGASSRNRGMNSVTWYLAVPASRPDDDQRRTPEERLRYLRELDERREAILKEITAQGKLTDELAGQIRAADSKARLEDLYLPYKPKRRTKAQIAREAGLEPLADLLLENPDKDPQTEAANFVDPDKNVPDANAALDGARAILVERFAEDAMLIGT